MKKSNAVRKAQEPPKPPEQGQPTAATSIRVTDFFGDPILSTDAIVDREKRQIAELLDDARKAMHELHHKVEWMEVTFGLINREMSAIKHHLATISPPAEKIHRLLDLVEDMPSAVRGELMIPLGDNAPPLAEGQQPAPAAEKFSPSMAAAYANQASFCLQQLARMLKSVAEKT